MTTQSDEYMVNGKRYQGRALRATRAGRGNQVNVLQWARERLDPAAVAIKGSSKHRYLMPLDAEMRKRILPLAQPYPKRAGSIASDAPRDQRGEGGLTPTPALHPDGGRA